MSIPTGSCVGVRKRVVDGLDHSWLDWAVIRVECLRTIAGFTLISLDQAIPARAYQPLPTPLGSLDAFHLASDLLVRLQMPGLTLATHDLALGAVARVIGFRVHGMAFE